jgi:hypothetical protein
MEHRKAVLGGERGEIVGVEKLAMVEKRIVVVGPANITWAICTEKKKGTFALSGGDIKFGLVFKPSSGGLCCKVSHFLLCIQQIFEYFGGKRGTRERECLDMTARLSPLPCVSNTPRDTVHPITKLSGK